MPVSVTMPRLGESVTEGTVTRWLKKEGERVEADEPLLEVSTDKVDTEIPAPASGVVSAIRVKEDETVEVGAELAVIDEAGTAGGATAAAESAETPGAESAETPGAESAESPGAESAEAAAEPAGDSGPEPEPEAAPADGEAARSKDEPTQPQAESAPPAVPQPETATAAAAEAAPPEVAERGRSRVESAPAPGGRSGAEGGDNPAYVTPLVRRLAAEHDVDLGSVNGTGLGGRIRKQDVLDAARQRGSRPAAPPPAAAAAAPVGATTRGGSAPARQPSAAGASGVAAATHLRGRTEKLSRLRTVIAQRMVESLHVSAQLTTVVEADVTRIARLRQRAKSSFEQREGVRLTFLPFFAVAAVEALKSHPAVNASIDLEAGTVTYHEGVHLGIAVDTERGLLVPVIHDAGDLNLGGVARHIADLADRTRSNRIAPDELGGGTFTLTNTGSRGALFDTPIVNQPQVAILGTGSVVKRPVVVDDPELGEVVAVRSMVYLALTYDHRLVDGADAARFLTTVKERLEEGRFEAELGLLDG